MHAYRTPAHTNCFEQPGMSGSEPLRPPTTRKQMAWPSFTIAPCALPLPAPSLLPLPATNLRAQSLSSFSNIKSWHRSLAAHAPPTVNCTLVANKCDQKEQRAVTTRFLPFGEGRGGEGEDSPPILVLSLPTPFPTPNQSRA